MTPLLNRIHQSENTIFKKLIEAFLDDDVIGEVFLPLEVVKVLEEVIISN